MKLNSLPHPVLIKLMELDERGERLAALADAAEAKLEHARNILNGRVEDRRIDIARLRSEFDSIHAAAQEARRRANIEQKVLSKLKVWIAQLPAGGLEVVKPQLNGHDLSSVRSRLAAVATEISAIESAPEPPPRANIEAYAARLAAAGRPAFRAGKVYWPAHEHATNRAQLTDFSDTDANPLLLEAWLRPEQFAERLYETRVQECDRPIPLAGRAERLAALHVELEQLRYAEAALVNNAISAGAADVTHDPACPPEAILSVRVNGGA